MTHVLLDFIASERHILCNTLLFVQFFFRHEVTYFIDIFNWFWQ